jgi:hypothetical protein
VYASILPFVFSALMLGAAVGLFFRGRAGMAIALAVAVISSAVGLQFILNSSEAPGFTEPLSYSYLVAKVATDVGLFVQYLVVFLVCWGRRGAQSNISIESGSPAAPTHLER